MVRTGTSVVELSDAARSRIIALNQILATRSVRVNTPKPASRGSVSGYPTSMIGLCQEDKSSPDALRRSAGVNPFWFFAACVGLSAVVPVSVEPDFHDRSLSRGQKLSRRASEERGCKFFLVLRRVCWPLSRGSFLIEEPDFHLLAQPFQLPRRLSLCFPARVETNQREHPELALLRPVALTARPGRLRVEEILLASPPRSTQRCSYSSPPPENSAAHGRPPRGRPPTSAPPPALRDWHGPSAFPCHRAWPAPGCFAGPSLLPRSASSVNVCCAVLRAACVAPYSRNSSLRYTTR